MFIVYNEAVETYYCLFQMIGFKENTKTSNRSRFMAVTKIHNKNEIHEIYKQQSKSEG